MKIQVTTPPRLAAFLFCWLALLGIAAAAARPNFLFLLSDDQDWIETSVQMHPDIPTSKSPHIQTPTLELLASQGKRFSQAYAPAPVCSPTRISLQTGKSPAQVHWTKAAPTVTAEDGYKLIAPTLDRQIASSHITIAERLKSVGYATAHYGKWHLSGGGPEQHGYDASDGDTGNQDAAPFMGDNPVDIFGMGERAMAFMENSHNAQTPFYIQMSYHALHYPENARPDTYAKYQALLPSANEKTIGRAALAENLDEGISLLLAKIEALGIADNTYVVYMSDNGGGGNSNTRPISGGKGDLREGGIRVPFIIRGPGIEPNSWSHQAIVGYDLYNTFSELAGIDTPFPEGIEGGSIVPILQGQDLPVVRPREGLYFHFPHYQGDTPQSVIILGDYKLIHYYETGEDLLFNLSTDLKESNDLSAQLPEKTEELGRKLTSYLAEINASLPTPNPLFQGNGDGPIITSIPDKTIAPGHTLRVTCNASSASPVTFTLSVAPEGASIDSQTGEITWTSNETHAGTIQTFTVLASDGSLSDTETFYAIVTSPDSGESAIYNLVLGSPRDDSILVSILTSEARDVYLEYGASPGSLTERTNTVTTSAGQPTEIQLDQLTPNQKYYYRLRHAAPGGPTFEAGTTRSFHTRRPAGESFTFLIEADPHHMD
ncbi:MAG: sulfatase-like hydrolase/transferase, partial [Limisphaerales bacterium]